MTVYRLLSECFFAKIAILVPERTFDINVPEYTEKDDKLDEFFKCSKTSEGWWKTPDGQCVVTPEVMRELMKKTHGTTHMGAEALVEMIRTCNWH